MRVAGSKVAVTQLRNKAGETVGKSWAGKEERKALGFGIFIAEGWMC